MDKNLDWLGPLSAAVDHWVPLVRGGDPLARQPPLMHRKCNAEKGSSDNARPKTPTSRDGTAAEGGG